MTTRNDITGDLIASRNPTEAYKDGWERIFGKKEKPQETPNQPINKNDDLGDKQ